MSAPRRAECRRLIDEAGAGTTSDADDSEQLAEAIEHIRAHPEEASRHGKAGRKWVLENFRREVLAERMLAFLQRVAGA
jgi:glycosyltransferase involved in cell wall biosynthesis